MATESFWTASEARDQAASRATVISEIAAIEAEVAVQIAAGTLTATIGPGTTPTPIVTTLTASTDAYDAWADPQSNQDDVHIKAREQMSRVISHFTKLGYSIVREREGVTSTFNWIVKW